MIKTISQETYNALKAKINSYDRYVKKHFWDPKTQTAVYSPLQVPPNVPSVSNLEQSQVEVFEFINHKPKSCKLYVRLDGPKSLSFTATTWLGDELGRGVIVKKVSRKVNATSRITEFKVRIDGLNGCKYEGTFHHHKGQYATVERV